MKLISDEELIALRSKLTEANPVAVGYNIMVRPIPVAEGLEAAEAQAAPTLAAAGFVSKTNNEQERQTHGSDVGVIAHLGPDAYESGQLKERGAWVKEGDVVIFPRYCGHCCELPPGSGIKYHFMADDDLKGKYEGIEL